MTDPNRYTRLQIERELVWRNCVADAAYFLNEHWAINQVGKGYAKTGLWPHQREMLDHMVSQLPTFQARSVYLKARQIGFTTIAMGLSFWSGFFHEDHPWLITSQGEDEAADTLSTKLKQPYLLLPAWMQKRGPQVTKDTNEVLELDNGSRFMAIPSTSKAGRSKAVYGICGDEWAFQYDAAENFAALDPLCYGPMFIFSTANGMGNHFHSLWEDAQQSGSSWTSLFFDRMVVPGRDEEWLDSQKRKYRATPHLMAQEYPENPTEAFLKSGTVAFDVQHLTDTQPFMPPAARYDLTLPNVIAASPSVPLETPWLEVVDERERDLELWVWEPPHVERHPDGRIMRKPSYVLGSDVSEGLTHGDYSAGSVFDVHTKEQVAAWRCHIPIFDLGRFLEALGYWYHEALIVTERNAMGLAPLVYLQEKQYPRLYRMEQFAQIKLGDRTPRYGWHTSSATKPKLVNDFAKVLASEGIILHDERLLSEAGTFINDGRGQFSAKPPNHDDLMMGTLVGWQGVLDAPEYPLSWIDPDPGPMTMGQLFGELEVVEKGQHPLSVPIGSEAQKASATVRSFEMIR